MSKCFQPVAQVQDTEADRLSTFFSRNTYISGKYADEDSFSKLHTHILSLPGGNEANRLFYLALPPTVYHDVTKNIKHHCMSTKSVHALLFLFYCLHGSVRTLSSVLLEFIVPSDLCFAYF